MFGIPEEHIENLYKIGHQSCFNPEKSLIEECGELITALAKFINDRVSYEEGVQHIYEEITHVLIAINLFSSMYGYDKKAIMKEVKSKAVKEGWDISNYTW